MLHISDGLRPYCGFLLCIVFDLNRFIRKPHLLRILAH